MNRKQTGRIKLTAKLLDNLDECQQILNMIKFMPLKVEHDWCRNQLELCGTSPFFKNVEEGYEMPEYRLEVTTNNDGEIVEVEPI